MTTPDPVGDVILPSAFTLSKRTPVLADHGGAPIGDITKHEIGADGLLVSGVLDTQSGTYQALKCGELDGLSIGFSGEFEQAGPLRIFAQVAVHGVSIVKQPMNLGSRVSAVKSWRDLESELELQRFLKGAGAPGRLAAKLAAHCWPMLRQTPDEEPALSPAALAALERIANVLR